jgi:hypothetical protein
MKVLELIFDENDYDDVAAMIKQIEGVVKVIKSKEFKDEFLKKEKVGLPKIVVKITQTHIQR